MKSDPAAGKPRRSKFQELLKRRDDNERGRGREQRHSLEGLRLSALLKQMQALQAIQGLQELAPRKPGAPARFEFATNAEERARQRQWLEYKSDWLQAMLEDAITELEALDAFERDLTAAGGAGGPGGPSGPAGGKTREG